MDKRTEVTLPTVCGDGGVSVTMPTMTSGAPGTDGTGGAVLAEGAVFEKYRIERLLAKGGMGAVYLARHEVLDTHFALKVLFPSVASRDGDFVERFIREAKFASKIRHPNLIVVHDAGRNAETGLYYLVMDYVPNGSLRDRLAVAGRILPCGVVNIVRQVAGALREAHRCDMIHRDIKPENIMFDEKGEARLADLGIAKSTSSKDTMLTMAAAVMGTPSYMSPEQAKDSGKIDERADIYSLGIVFYEMLAGHCPFSGSTALEILSKVISEEKAPPVSKACPDVPEAMAALVHEMIEKDPDKRIPSADALIARLDALEKPPSPGKTASTSVISEGGEKKPRNRMLLRLIAGLACAVIAVCVAVLFMQDGDSRPTANPAPAPAHAVVDLVATNESSSVTNILAEPTSVTKPVQDLDSETNAPAEQVSVKKTVALPEANAVNETAVDAVPKPEIKPENRKKKPVPAPPGVTERKELLFEPRCRTRQQVMNELEKAIESKPAAIRICLGRYAESRNMSLGSFEIMVGKVIERLKRTDIPFSLVPDGGNYGTIVQELARKHGCDVR